MPPVKLHFVAARSKTGKTTIVENLLPLFKKRGISVAALKGNLRHYDFDLPGKDSWRFKTAGADVAGFTTPEGYILNGFREGLNGSEAALELLEPIIDLVIVEGDKKTKYPKIEVLRKDMGNDPLLKENTIALVTDRLDLEVNIPLFALDAYEKLAAFIISYFSLENRQNKTGTGSPAGLTGNSMPEKTTLTHFDRSGRPRMVDISNKESTAREAYAGGEIVMAPGTLKMIKAGNMAKGDVLSVAQVAAVMAVKETGRIIPMAHPLGISGVEVDFETVEGNPSKIQIGVRVRLSGKTGVEMEALTGVSVAALTIYDMCKAVDKNMSIENIRLLEKKGGRSGHYRREQN